MVRPTSLDRDRETKKEADTDRQTQTDRHRQTDTDRQTQTDRHRQTDTDRQTQTDRHRQGPHLAMTSLRIKNWSVTLAAPCDAPCAKQNAAPALRTTHFL